MKHYQKIKSRDYSTTKYVSKNPFGMKDFTPAEISIREAILDKIKAIFKTHGAVLIDTPIVELKETLTGKYGEDSKLIYDLKDLGREVLVLEYVLTVPFARYYAQHNVENIKRYHLAKAYRRNRPAIKKGRFREFYQGYFDIARSYVNMSTDAECVTIVSEILGGLDLGIEYLIKVNHRKLLDRIFAISGMVLVLSFAVTILLCVGIFSFFIIYIG